MEVVTKGSVRVLPGKRLCLENVEIVLSAQAIEERARVLWLEYGCPKARDEEIWLEAERRLREETQEAIRAIIAQGVPRLREKRLFRKTRPHVFVGSSTEGLDIAKMVQLLLYPSCEVKIWTQGVIRPSASVLESLIKELKACDFAILVFTPDDLVESRGERSLSARDNVILELGMFLGHLGLERTFLVYDGTASVRMPTDLAGITAITYHPPEDDDWEAALGAPCTRIRREIERLGIRL